ncbi:MAG: endonuclease/exonuclease/phosphatase family protein, partial [Propionibacteriaceae bacterium]|nr:endonuclease/exonuclease/phosphatase family protein [Propionibacteriaceae bacterium]
MRFAAFNVNGLRAAERRGFRAWLDAAQPDVAALQEVRCPASQIPAAATAGYEWAYDPGTVPGRNGVALLSKTPPLAVRGLSEAGEFAAEGRYIEADYDIAGRPVTLASLYLPKGAVPLSPADKDKHDRKMRFCEILAAHLARAVQAAAASGR